MLVWHVRLCPLPCDPPNHLFHRRDSSWLHQSSPLSLLPYVSSALLCPSWLKTIQTRPPPNFPLLVRALSVSLCTASAATAVGFTQLWITRKTSNFRNRLQKARRCSSPTKFRPSLAKSNQIPQSNTFSQRSMQTQQQQQKERRKHN